MSTNNSWDSDDIQFVVEKATLSSWNPSIEEIEELDQWVEYIIAVVKECRQSFDLDDLQQVFRCLCIFYNQKNAIQQCVFWAEERVEHVREHIKNDYSSLALALSDLGVQYNDACFFGKAEKTLLEAYTICQETNDSNLTLIVEDSLVSLYRDLVRHDLVIHYCSKILKSPHLSNMSPSYWVKVLSNLSYSLVKLGKYDTAELYLNRTLDIAERELGADDNGTAVILNGLAEVYRSKKRTSEAEHLYKRALSILEKCNQIGAAAILDNLGQLNRPNDFERAENYYKRALKIREQFLGKEHPTTAITLTNLGRLYFEYGYHLFAQRLLRRALAAKRKYLQEDHSSLGSTLDILAIVNSCMGYHQEALELSKKALHIHEIQQGDNKFVVSKNLSTLLYIYIKLEKYNLAEEIAQQLIEIVNIATEVVLFGNLGKIYLSTGRYEEAEAMLKSAIKKSETENVGAENIGMFFCNLGDLYRITKRYQESEEAFLTGMQKFEELSSIHPQSAQGLRLFAKFCREIGKYAKAKKLLKQALEICEERLGVDAPITVATALELSGLEAK